MLASLPWRVGLCYGDSSVVISPWLLFPSLCQSQKRTFLESPPQEPHVLPGDKSHGSVVMTVSFMLINMPSSSVHQNHTKCSSQFMALVASAPGKWSGSDSLCVLASLYVVVAVCPSTSILWHFQENDWSLDCPDFCCGCCKDRSDNLQALCTLELNQRSKLGIEIVCGSELFGGRSSGIVHVKCLEQFQTQSKCLINFSFYYHIREVLQFYSC